MNRIILPYVFLACTFCLFPTLVQAQIGPNIIKYGDFAKSKPNGKFPEGWSWRTSYYHDYKKGTNWSRPGSSDDRSLLLQPYTNQSLTSNQAGQENLLLVEPGAEYKLTLWAKDHNGGSSKRNQFDVEFDWYAENEPGDSFTPSARRQKMASFTMTADWKKHEATVKIPDGVHSAAFRIRFQTEESMVLIDDISMIKTKDGAGDGVPKPIGIKTEIAQHEIEVKWSPSKDPGVNWVYQVDNGEVIQLGKATSLQLERLMPQTKKKISIWGEKGEKMSDKEVLELTTQPFKYKIDDPMRIPHLRTISAAGTCWRYLKLYYQELHNLDASVVYRQNGKEIKPNADGILELGWEPTVSEFLDRTILEVTIDEGQGRVWTLTYNLTVSKDPVNY